MLIKKEVKTWIHMEKPTDKPRNGPNLTKRLQQQPRLKIPLKNNNNNNNSFRKAATDETHEPF